MTFKCYLCGESENKILADSDVIRFGCFGHNKKFVKCTSCGLVQLYPVWTKVELNELYSKYSKKEDFKGASPKRTITKYLLGQLREGDKILEVGCSFGDNVWLIQKKGYDIIGIDRDPGVCDGKTILNFDYNNFVGTEGKFDFIYAIHVFEHIQDPIEFIDWIKKNLSDRGRFLLELPSINDPLIKLYKINEFNKFYWYPYHFFYYNSNTLKSLFEKVPNFNIKVKLIQRYGLINHLRWLFLKKPGNFNPDIPILDKIYKFIVTRIFKLSDTIMLTGEKV